MTSITDNPSDDNFKQRFRKKKTRKPGSYPCVS